MELMDMVKQLHQKPDELLAAWLQYLWNLGVTESSAQQNRWRKWPQ